MQVVDVTFGAGVPHITNLQALASPSSAIWPQAVFDFDFTGESCHTYWKVCASHVHSRPHA